MDESRPRQEQQEIEATAALPVTNLPEPASDVEEERPGVSRAEPDPGYRERVPQPESREGVSRPLVEEDRAGGEAVFPRLDHDVASGLTVGDGFRFGCGFVLALAIGTLAFLVVMTTFLAVGTLMGFKLPF